MSAADAFDALRTYKRELTGQPLVQSDVDYVNVLFGQWEAAATPAPQPAPAPAQPTGTIAPMAWGAKVSATFRARVQWIAGQLSVEASDLMACMAWESGRTFSASITNKAGSGATGLIQFMPSVAISLGTTVAALAAMTAEDQLNYVFKYFEPYIGKLHDLGDLYMAILWPAAVGQTDSYELWNSSTRPTTYRQNAGLDLDHNGSITKGECSAKLYAIRAEGMQPGNFG